MSFTDSRHGTVERYWKKCRCGSCKGAYNTYQRVQRKSRSARRGGTTPDPLLPHGRVSTYSNWGCRCDRCTEAATSAVRESRRKA